MAFVAAAGPIANLVMALLWALIMKLVLSSHGALMGLTMPVYYMAIVGININVLLMVLNLLPIPILDGGHLFFFTLEAIRGKPVEVHYREMAQGVGLMLILALMILVFYHDILRLVQPQY